MDMAERHRSKDGVSETEQILGDMPDTPDFQGREGGDLARKVATRDELKRMGGRQDAGATRVTKSVEQDEDEEDTRHPEKGGNTSKDTDGGTA
jgi:hypothetical protein